VGNIDIELKLDEKGKFRIKAFSRSADHVFQLSGQYATERRRICIPGRIQLVPSVMAEVV
jgi:hypothetical protein